MFPWLYKSIILFEFSGYIGVSSFKNPVSLQHIIKDNRNNKVGNNTADFIVYLKKCSQQIGARHFQYDTVYNHEDKTKQLFP